MDDSSAVSIAQGVGGLARDLDRLVQGKLLLSVEPIPQRLTFHVGHHVVKHTVRLAGVEERENVWVVEASGERDLAQEPLGAERGSEFGLENFERNLARVLVILREVYRSHSATAKLAQNLVSPGKGSFQVLEVISQGVLVPFYNLEWNGVNGASRADHETKGALPLQSCGSRRNKQLDRWRRRFAGTIRRTHMPRNRTGRTIYATKLSMSLEGAPVNAPRQDNGSER